MKLSEIKIAHRDPKQKIWLVRATGGRFVRHFRNGSVITIRHLDEFYDHRNEASNEVPTRDQIFRLIASKSKYSDKKSKTPKLNASGNNKFHQIMHFIEDIKKGDLVISVDDNNLSIGICKSTKAKLSSRPIKSSPEADTLKSIKLEHRLRKSVTWGPLIKRNNIQGPIKKALQSRHTITNLSEHWQSVFGLIYPFFTDGNNLYFSQKISAHHDISGKAIGKLFENLSSVQPIAEELLKREIGKEFIDSLLNDELDWSNFNLTTKAEFMSPGIILNKIPLPKGMSKRLAILCFSVLLLINSGLISAEEAASQLSTEDYSESIYTPDGMIQERYLQSQGDDNVKRLLGELLKQNNDQLEKLKTAQKTQKIKSSLKSTIPKHDTSTLEESHGIKITRISNNEE